MVDDDKIGASFCQTLKGGIEEAGGGANVRDVDKEQKMEERRHSGGGPEKQLNEHPRVSVSRGCLPFLCRISLDLISQTVHPFFKHTLHT